MNRSEWSRLSRDLRGLDYVRFLNPEGGKERLHTPSVTHLGAWIVRIAVANLQEREGWSAPGLILFGHETWGANQGRSVVLESNRIRASEPQFYQQ